MILVKIVKVDGSIRSVDCSGHSKYARSGYDIVCAAVSTLVQTAVMSIEQLLDIKLNAFIDEKNGILKFDLPNNLSDDAMHDAQVILKSMLIGIKDIEKSYKKNVYVKEN